jgi:PAS domain-containing protein
MFSMPGVSRQSQGKPSQIYLFAATAVVAATVLRLLAGPFCGNSVPYIAYILPIMAVAAYGGFAPGLFATISSTLALVVVFLGGRVLTVPDAPYLFLFLLDGLYISWLGEQMRGAVRAAEQSRAEADTVRARERAILNSISDAFGSLDAEWRFVHANENLAALTSLPVSGLLGKSVWEVWPELAAHPAREEIERAAQTRTPRRVEVFMPVANRWYETCAYP